MQKNILEIGAFLDGNLNLNNHSFYLGSSKMKKKKKERKTCKTYNSI